MADPRHTLLDLLVKLARLPADEPTGALVAELKEAALEVVPAGRVGSLGIRGTSAAIGDIINHLESIPLPPEIARGFPDLDQEKWEYALRIVTLILSMLEPDT